MPICQLRRDIRNQKPNNAINNYHLEKMNKGKKQYGSFNENIIFLNPPEFSIVFFCFTAHNHVAVWAQLIYTDLAFAL